MKHACAESKRSLAKFQGRIRNAERLLAAEEAAVNEALEAGAKVVDVVEE